MQGEGFAFFRMRGLLLVRWELPASYPWPGLAYWKKIQRAAHNTEVSHD